MLAGVRLDAIEVHEREILSDRLDVLGHRLQDRLLELARELEAARPQDVDVGRVDKEVEIVVELEDIIFDQL